MKKLCLLMAMVCTTYIASAQCGNLYIAGALDGSLSGGLPKAVQLCATGPISDLSIYGIESVSNGSGSGGSQEFALSAVALNSGDCYWVTSDAVAFNTFFGFDACQESGVLNSNGDDAYLLYCSGTVADVAGDPDNDGTGTPWEYQDGWLFSSDTSPNATFDDTEWSYSGVNGLENGSDNATADTPYPSTTSNCPGALILGCTDPAACNYDSAAEEDNGSCFSVGDTCDDGDITTTSDVYTDCSTCAGTSTGVTTCTTVTCSDFTIVPVTTNSQGDDWSCTGDAWNANGFTGSAGETTDTWLVLGTYDLTSTSSIFLNLDALENFSGSNLEIFYTGSYTGCPGDAGNSWASAGIIASGSGGAGLSFDLSAAAGLTDVYIGVQYLSGSAGGAASNWTVSNVTVTADTCPALSAPVTSACTTTFDCPALSLNIGDACDDMDASTTNDAVNASCECIGTTVGGSCPASAKINEFHYDNIGTDINEFVEIALPAGSDPTQIRVDLYNGNGGSSYANTTLSAAEFVSTDGTLDYYVWNISMQNGNDGIATSCIDGTQYMFLTYEDAFMATDGPFSGVMGVDVGVEESNGSTLDSQSIMCDGMGGYLTNCTADAGATNDLSSCDAPVASGCMDPVACNYDSDATSDDGSCFSVGDSCDDMDASTSGDVWTDCMTCAGTASGLTECDPPPAVFAESEVDNTDGDVWTMITDGYSMNGYCGSQCEQDIDQWLIFGPIDFTNITMAQLDFLASEGFGITDLNVQWSNNYMGGLPSGATWTSVLTVTDDAIPLHSAVLSGATGTAVYIGIQYLDNGEDGYSAWELTDFTFLADECPTISFDCPLINADIGDSCDDGDPLTTGSTVQADCECAGGILLEDCSPNEGTFPWNGQ